MEKIGKLTGLLRRYTPRNDNERLNIFISRQLKGTLSRRNGKNSKVLFNNCHCEKISDFRGSPAVIRLSNLINF